MGISLSTGGCLGGEQGVREDFDRRNPEGNRSQGNGPLEPE